jgi:hypothetical protein
MPEEGDHQAKTIAWLRTNLPDLRCPICRGEGFTVGEMLAAPVVAHEVIHVGLTVPFVPVMCRACGNTLLFSAVHMGLIPPTSDNGNADVNPPQIPYG